MDLSGSAMSIPDENLKLFVPLRRNLGNIEFGLALYVSLIQFLAFTFVPHITVIFVLRPFLPLHHKEDHHHQGHQGDQATDHYGHDDSIDFLDDDLRNLAVE